MRFAVHMAIWKRFPLARAVLRNLRELDIAPHTIDIAIAGSESDRSRWIAEEFSAAYVEERNKPLGRKLNAAVKLCHEFKPDALIGLGSDDLITADTIRAIATELEDGADYVGFVDYYAMWLPDREVVYWPGYTNHRRGETVGAGRVVTAQLADRLGWEIFDSTADRSIDYSMTRAIEALGDVTTRNLSCVGCPVVDVKTPANVTAMPPGETMTGDGARGWFVDAFGQRVWEELIEIQC